jgi:hypothetical protein
MTTTPKKPHGHYVVARYAGDWTRGSVRGCFGSRVAAKQFARALRSKISDSTVIMVLRDDQLKLANERGFTAYV